MATAEAAARYLLHLASSDEEPSPVTHMQLQKLLYYAQGWNLAMHGVPLFDARIEAWVHGPVVREVYPLFAKFESAALPRSESIQNATLSDDERAMIGSIWRRYGRFSAWRLRQMTHNEAPWTSARGDHPQQTPTNAPISNESLRSHFTRIHEEDCRRMSVDATAIAHARADAMAGRTHSFRDVFGGGAR